MKEEEWWIFSRENSGKEHFMFLEVGWEISRFVCALIIFGLSPGYLLASYLKLKLTRLEKIILSLGLGIVISCSIYFFSGFLKIRPVADLIICLSALVFFVLALKKVQPISTGLFKIRIHKLLINPAVLPLLIIIFCSYFQASLLSGSGLDPDGSLKMGNIGDGMWLISLSRELSKSIPPVHPGFAPEIVSNYHYFTHLFIGLVYRFTDINMVNLYFNDFSWFFGVFLGLTAYIFGRRFLKNKFPANLLVILTYSAGSFSYLLPLWLGKNFAWNDSTFWVSQPFNLILNPSVMLSFSLFNLTIYCAYRYWVENEKNYAIPLILFAGTLIAFKVYAGILVTAALGILVIPDLLKKNWSTLKIYFGILILNFTVFYPVNGNEPGSFMVYAPFWYLHTMVENPDRLNLGMTAIKEQYYWSTNNFFAVVRLRMGELLIFVAGNLGIRLISIFLLPFYLVKRIKPNRFDLFLWTLFFMGIIIPLFFIQSGSVANTIQFFYYSLIIGNIFTVYLIKYIYNRKPRFAFVIGIILIFFSLPTTVKSAFSHNLNVIPKDRVAAVNALKANTGPDEIILLPPSPENYSSMYVSVISQRNTFYSQRLMAENTKKNYQLREEELQKFFYPSDKKQGKIFQKSFLMKYNLSTLYLTEIESDILKNISIPYEIIFKNPGGLVIRFI